MKNTTRIFLVRHGQTEWNAEERLQGHQNSALTALGQQQAVAIKNTLEPFDIAYCSPLLRAQETLKIIDSNIDVIVSEGLKEIKLGPWEGKTKAETKQSHPESYQHFWHEPERFSLAGTETFQQLQTRVVNALYSIFVTEQGKNILVISHWIAIKVALAHYSNIALKDLATLENPNNGKIIVLSQKTGQLLIDKEQYTS